MSNIFNTTVNDTDESLRGKSGGQFGLNSGFITKLEYNGLAGKDGSEGDAVDITAQVGDKEFRRRIYDATGPLFGAKNAKIEPGEEGYADLYNTEMKQRMAVVTHAVKAVGVTADQIKAAVSAAVDFKSWATIMTALPSADYKTKPVDIFVEYQWNISDGQDKTFLELPKNMKGGYFLCPVQKAVGTWSVVNDSEGMHYADDAGNKHPFDRSVNYMKGNKAIQQIEGQDSVEEEKAGSGSTSEW
mgnify:CR=1 FL=1|tara:strand:- start:361 stop:1092 length:732 start_codon:yes stop_codon:yes gene_type:complete